MLCVLHVRLFGPSCTGQSNELLLPFAHELVFVHVEEAPKSVHGQVFQIVYRHRGWPLQEGTVVENFALIPESDALVTFRICQRGASLDDRPIGNAHRPHRPEAGERCRQTQAKVDGFEQRVISPTENFRVEFHDGRAPQIFHAVVFFIIVDSFRNIYEGFAEPGGTLACFRVVLRQVLQDGPQVQERAPIDVAHVAQEQVLFVRVQQSVVSRQKQVLQARPVRIVFDHSILQRSQEAQKPREQVAAVHVLFTVTRGPFFCTSVDSPLRRSFTVPRVALTVFEKRQEQTLQGPEVDWRVVRASENGVQQGEQVRALRLVQVFGRKHFMDVIEQRSAVRVFGRVPLCHVLAEEGPELHFGFTMRAHFVRVRVPVRQQLLLGRVVVDDTLERRTVCDVRLAVCVRVAVRSPLVAHPIQKRLLECAWHDVGHDVAHEQFDAQSVHERDDVGVVEHPRETVLTCCRCIAAGLRHWPFVLSACNGCRGFVEAVQFVRVVVREIQRGPERRRATVAETIRDGDTGQITPHAFSGAFGRHVRAAGQRRVASEHSFVVVVAQPRGGSARSFRIRVLRRICIIIDIPIRAGPIALISRRLVSARARSVCLGHGRNVGLCTDECGSVDLFAVHNRRVTAGRGLCSKNVDNGCGLQVSTPADVGSCDRVSAPPHIVQNCCLSTVSPRRLPRHLAHDPLEVGAFALPLHGRAGQIRPVGAELRQQILSLVDELP